MEEKPSRPAELVRRRLARQEDAILRRHGLLWSIILLTLLRPLSADALAREITIETEFDDAAAFEPLRLIDERSNSGLRFEPDAVDPLPVNDGPIFDDHSEPGFDGQLGYQLLPKGLLYRSYIAGEKEPRFQSIWLNETGRGRVWETQMGGRIGLVRYANCKEDGRVGAWQLDMEGGAQARVDPEQNSDLEAVDYRFGILSTWRFGQNAFKAGYYHLSSHAGDEYLLANPGFIRVNYVRDSAIIGWTHDFTEDSQIYGEVAYAGGHEGGAEPLELQYGYQYTPLRAYGFKGAPYFGINGHTRQDFNWITSINTVAGWQWRGEETSHLFRVGLQYYTGPALQWQFAGRNETLYGAGLWFDY